MRPKGCYRKSQTSTRKNSDRGWRASSQGKEKTISSCRPTSKHRGTKSQKASLGACDAHDTILNYLMRPAESYTAQPRICQAYPRGMKRCLKAPLPLCVSQHKNALVAGVSDDSSISSVDNHPRSQSSVSSSPSSDADQCQLRPVSLGLELASPQITFVRKKASANTSYEIASAGPC